MAECNASDLVAWVRFPLPAPFFLLENIFCISISEYLVNYVNTRKYPMILFVMSKIMEMNKTEQNQVAMYLYNSI